MQKENEKNRNRVINHHEATRSFLEELYSWDVSDLLNTIKEVEAAWLSTEHADDTQKRSSHLFYLNMLKQWLDIIQHIDHDELLVLTPEAEFYQYIEDVLQK